MDVLEEAKEIIEKAGCKNAYAVYKLNIDEIAEIRECNKKCEFIELKRNPHDLDPGIVKELEIDKEKPIECPLGSSSSKYLEISLINRSIVPYDINNIELERIEQEIKPLLEKYHWSIKKL